MADSSLNDLSSQGILNLTEQEKRAYSFLFQQADSDQLGVVTGERAVSFFERTKVSPNVLGEIWQIADTENRGLLTKPGFCMVLRLIGHYQAGREPSAELAFKPAPIPKFEGLQIPGANVVPVSPTGGGFPANALQPQLSGQGPIRVPPLDAQKAQQYSGLFERSGAQGGVLDGATAKSIFERAGLPNEVLGKIWSLADREQRGALDQTEFIVAMHLLTSMKTRAMTALPNTLPPGTSPGGAKTVCRRPYWRATPNAESAREGTGVWHTSVGIRTARRPTMLITPQEKVKYDQFFASIDTQGRGILTGEQAVSFFSDSRLPEETLAQIWDLADINSEGQLNKDEFAVAMYLIRQQRAPNPSPLPAFLPPALMPPSMRQQQQSTQSTAPAFDNANNTHNLPKSAADDLFGLDEPSQPSQPAIQPQTTGFQAPLQTQTTGQSTTRDPFNGSVPGSPSSPQRFPPAPQQAQQNTMFKPFMPTSAFGASLAQQHTGGSATSSQRGFQPQQPTQSSHLQQASISEDLLGDNDTNATERSRMTNETTELANMSNQIGNLRNQMESTQANKTRTQADVTATNQQKQAMEQRLQQFRAQYEQEVRTVKELETQLAASRESTKKLSQELAMLEGTHQDLQTQHTIIAQQLQADQAENANLKMRLSQINTEVTRLKPEIEKMKLDARQQKGLVSIGKKQLATAEGERDRLQSEKVDLEREAAEREEAAKNLSQQQQSNHHGRDAAIGAGVGAAAGAAAFGGYEAMKDRQGSGYASPAAGSNVTSPSGLSSMNPFFRKPSDQTAMSPPATQGSGPTPSAFDQLFGPSAAFSPSGQDPSRSGTPPATSFIGRNLPAPISGAAAGSGMTDSVQSMSSVGAPTPSATPPMSEQAKDSPMTAVDAPPPPPEDRQFTPSQLPVGGIPDRTREDSEVGSTQVVPPASRMGDAESSRQIGAGGLDAQIPEPPMPGAFDARTDPEHEEVAAAFPSVEPQPSTSAQEIQEMAAPATQTSVNDDFEAAFAGFGEGEKVKEGAKEEYDPFAPHATQQHSRGFSSEFPPIRDIEPDDDDDSSVEGGMHPAFDDNFATGQHAAAEPTMPLERAAAEFGTHAEEGNVASARPVAPGASSTRSELPTITQQTSPPSYEESEQPSHGGHGECADSNGFPREYGGLLPAREDPTSSTANFDSPEQAVVAKDNEMPSGPGGLQRQPTGNSVLSVAQPSSTAEVFHDAYSHPLSSATDLTSSVTAAASTQSSGPAKNAFDEFDDFDDLAEAKEADKTDFDFSHGTDEGFNPAFDSPTASTIAPSQRAMDSSQSSNGFGFHPSQSTVSAFGGASNSTLQSPQSAQHDWDAIFSGLDNGKAVDTSLGSGSAAVSDDPWGAPPATNAADRTPTATSPVASKAATAAQSVGRAVTPGTEHDDPILKRLTGMGYPRQDALTALEMFDYDINKAVDHLTEGTFG
ncbi:putative calcium-binding protein [Teratosphaeria destructans]|uniref:Calcium-binding protein n=1 Tax=Teratosphaeria destructans TaxID=418781 RepID=A0A9W7W6M9_9PEZI|nr:putative calcium-binding protein [Teratosphaeria destructans]